MMQNLSNSGVLTTCLAPWGRLFNGDKMKTRFFYLVCIVFFCGKATVLQGAQYVDITTMTDPGSGKSAYQVTLDFGGEDDYDAHFIIGQKYAEAILKVFRDQPGFERSVSSSLRQSLDELGASGVRYRDVMGRVAQLMSHSDDEGDAFYLAGAEIEGMNSVFNSSRNGYSSSDRLWWLIFNENQLTIRELYLLNMISNTLNGSTTASVQSSGSENPVNSALYPSVGGLTVSGKTFEGLRALHVIKNRGSRKDTVCESYLGCLFNTVKDDNTGKMMTSSAYTPRVEARH